MKLSKKIIALFIAVMIVVSAIPFTAFAATTYDSDYVYAYDLEEGDILATGLDAVMLSDYTLILQAGTYGYEDEDTYEMQRANTDLVLQQSGDLDVSLQDSPEGLRVSVFDFNQLEHYEYYPFDANGQTDRWVVVAIYDGPGNEPGEWVRSITLAGASAPVVYYNATFGASLIGDAAVKSVALSGDCFDDADTAQASTYAFHKNSGGNVEFTVMLETRNFDPTALIVTKGASTLPVYGSWGETYYYDCVFFSKIIDSQTGDITGYRYYLEANDDISIGYTSTPAGSFASLNKSATVVHFNDMDWYLIADHSTSATEGSVTLLAKECIGSGSDQYKTAYANSDIKASLDALTASGGAFEGVADAILSVNLADKNVTGAKLYLPSAKELESMRTDVLKCAQATGSQLNWWWLRSTAPNGCWQAVDANAGSIIGNPSANHTYGVRPALQLDLSKVEFDSETNTFALPAPTEPNNGTNITVADTISENFYLDDEFYGEDTYVAVNYNHNSNVSETADFQTDIKAMSALSELDDSTSPYDGARILSVIQAPAQSTETITINVYPTEQDAIDDTNAIGEPIEYSVYTYCRQIIEGTYEDDVKDLARATLDYAAAAQNYFEYNQGNMATKDNASNAYYGDVADFEMATVTASASAPGCIESFTVVVKSDLEINLLSRTPINVESASIDTTGTSRFAAESTTNGDWYVVHISGIEPANMDNTFTVVTDKGNIVMSANAIMKMMANSGDEKLVTLAKAMYLYGAAADTYFANQNA